jgi:hypothetical protein
VARKSDSDRFGKFPLCRDVLHAWTPYRATVVTNGHTGKREIHRLLECMRCGTVKKQRLATDGTPLGNIFDYAAGYLVAPGSGRMTRAQRAALRLSNIKEILR